MPRFSLPRRPGPYLWAAAGVSGGLSLAAYAVLNRSPAVMQRWLNGAALPVGRAMSALWRFSPFSAAEVCWTAAILWLLFFLVRAVRGMLRAQGGRARLRFLAKQAAVFACAALFVAGGYTGLWGVGYRAPSFYSVSGLEAKPVATAELERTTRLFAEAVNRYAGEVPRNEQGLYLFDKALFSRTDGLYTRLAGQFPALEGPVRRAKPMFYSPLMSLLGFTGFYFPFTGEANVNVHAPDSMIPFTIAHELAHQRGVVFEDEANFTGIAACLLSGEAAFRYSASLSGYLYLSNALLSADADAWLATRGLLAPEAQADLEANNAFWAQYETPVSSAAESIYEGFLQSHGEERGMRSYGACVDLLVAYYADTSQL